MPRFFAVCNEMPGHLKPSGGINRLRTAVAVEKIVDGSKTTTCFRCNIFLGFMNREDYRGI